VVMPNQSLGTQTAANVDTEGGRRPTVVWINPPQSKAARVSLN
jgi:hypothetical protein